MRKRRSWPGTADRIHPVLRIVVLIAALAMSFAAPTPARAHDAATEKAFVGFLSAANYENANFYLQNGLIDHSKLDTGQIFYDILHDTYWNRLDASGEEIRALYGYLSALGPVDLNREFPCHRSDRDKRWCSLLHDLAAGQPTPVIVFFAGLGLDLNKVFPARVPASFEIIDRLGAVYPISDIGILSQNGMVFGDETYPPALLAALRETRPERGPRAYSNSGSGRLRMPHNYLSVSAFNLMDVMALALGNGQGGQHQGIEASRRDDALCQYITFAAQSMAPSFDYLRFVLLNRTEFRAANIGESRRRGATVYQPFPSSCVALMAGMAQGHGNLADVVALFGAQGDVEMARWLLQLQAQAQVQAQQGAAARPGAAPASQSATPKQ